MTLQELDLDLDDSLMELRGHPQLLALIRDLKKALEDTDYMVIKCYEAQLANTDMPYDLQELLTIRNKWRNKISALEFEISMLG